MLRAQQEQPLLMTDQQIRDELMTFIFAGSDTTATTLAFAMYELSRNAEVQQQVAAEVVEALAGCPGGEPGVLHRDQQLKQIACSEQGGACVATYTELGQRRLHVGACAELAACAPDRLLQAPSLRTWCRSSSC